MNKHSKTVGNGMGDSGLPGVFFIYELSPMMVKYTEKQRYLTLKITEGLTTYTFPCLFEMVR